MGPVGPVGPYGTLSPSDSDSVGPVGPYGMLSPSDSVGHVDPYSCSHTYTDLGADPGGSATDVVRHCPPWSVLIRHHPPSSQSHYGGYATFLLRTRYDLMLSDGGLAADWRRTSGNRSRKTTVTLRWLASLGGRTTANPPRGAALLPRSVVETSECRSTTAAGPCP